MSISSSVTSSDEFWSVVDEQGNEVSLNQYAWAVTTYGGSPRAFPELRGDEPVYAFRPGSEFRPKVAEARTISFTMFVNGSDPRLESPPEDEDAQFTANWMGLQRLFWTPSRQIQLKRRWVVQTEQGREIKVATALAQIAGTMEPEMTSRSRATFTVELLLSDPYFYGDPKTVELAKDAPTDIVNDGSAPTTGYGCALTFPLADIEYDPALDITWEEWVTEFAGHESSFVSQAAGGGSTSTLVLAGGAALDYFKGWKIKIVGGPGAGDVRRIASNTFHASAATVSIQGTFSAAITADSSYILYPGAALLWPLNDLATASTAAQSIPQKDGYASGTLTRSAVNGAAASTLRLGVADTPVTVGGRVIQFSPAGPTKGTILTATSGPAVPPNPFRPQIGPNTFYGQNFSVLVKCSTFAEQVIFRVNDTFKSYLSLELTATGQAVAYYHPTFYSDGTFAPASEMAQVVSPNSVADGKWHQIGVSTAVNGLLALFVDGQMVNATLPSNFNGALGICDIYVGGLPAAAGQQAGSKMFTGRLSTLALYNDQLSYEGHETAYRAILGKSKGLFVQNDYYVDPGDGSDPVAAPELHQGHWVKMSVPLDSTGGDAVTMYMDHSVATVKNRQIAAFADCDENNYLRFPTAWDELPEPYAPVHFGSSSVGSAALGMIRSIDGLEYDRTYYVELVDKVSRRFTLSATLGGPRVQFKRLWNDAGAKVFAGEFPVTGAVSSYGAPQWVTLYPGVNRLSLSDLQGDRLEGKGQFYLTYREPYV